MTLVEFLLYLACGVLLIGYTGVSYHSFYWAGLRLNEQTYAWMEALHVFEVIAKDMSNAEQVRAGSQGPHIYMDKEIVCYQFDSSKIVRCQGNKSRPGYWASRSCISRTLQYAEFLYKDGGMEVVLPVGNEQLCCFFAPGSSS